MQEQRPTESTSVTPRGPNPPKPPPACIEEENRMRNEYKAMDKEIGLLSTAETLLRSPGRVVHELQHGKSTSLIKALCGITVLCLLIYGITVGLFSCGHQVWAAPLKITLGMAASALICLPSLVIFSCLSGSRMEMRHIVFLLVGSLSMASLLLLGFGPVSWIFTQSTESIGFMGALHLVFWAIGMYYGFRFLFSATRFLAGKRQQHLVVWSVIFVLVSLQMTATLRPILGTSEHFLQKDKKFFLTHWIESAGSVAGEEYQPFAHE